MDADQDYSQKYKMEEICYFASYMHAISFPEHARSQVKGGHSPGEIELIQACDWLTAGSTLDFQREFYACLAIVAKYK